MDIEKLVEAVHKAYCDERIRQRKETYWTNGDYNKLDEVAKEYDRATVRAVLEAVNFEELQKDLAHETDMELKLIVQALKVWHGDFPDSGCKPSLVWSRELEELIKKLESK
ncbi:hypothetical protein LCGC14_2020500 [marine sediment metagenome]|uniref:Uncharacterized protein n=1 Tax=marine sediment metagenome TaxID=412755 RepID=A0A0F9HAZ7_9ZZZZ